MLFTGVPRGACQPLWRETSKREHKPSVTGEHANALACRRIPQAHGLVPVAGDLSCGRCRWIVVVITQTPHSDRLVPRAADDLQRRRLAFDEQERPAVCRQKKKH